MGIASYRAAGPPANTSFRSMRLKPLPLVAYFVKKFTIFRVSSTVGQSPRTRPVHPSVMISNPRASIIRKSSSGDWPLVVR